MKRWMAFLLAISLLLMGLAAHAQTVAEEEETGFENSIDWTEADQGKLVIGLYFQEGIPLADAQKLLADTGNESFETLSSSEMDAMEDWRKGISYIEVSDDDKTLAMAIFPHTGSPMETAENFLREHGIESWESTEW